MAIEAEYASDDWVAARLGIPARRGQGVAHFGGIRQQWLREAAKRWCRFRLSTGCAFLTVKGGTTALGRFSLFLAERHPAVCHPSGITRDLLVDHLS